jgi:hypothetical protein
MPTLFAKTLVHSPHMRSFEIRAMQPGWEVVEREDERILRRRHSDWHRVERTKMRFMHKIAELQRQGWVEAATT